jgi:hypothetical protein
MNDENYDEYIGNGSLIYIIDQSNVYICYISNDIEEQESEFSDADNNHEYNLDWQLNKFPALRPILEKINIDPKDLQVNISLAETDQEKYNIALKAVQENGSALQYVPDNLKTTEMCMIAVKYGLALEYVPDNLKTTEMCMIAVKQNGYALQYVPDNLKTTEMFMIAVKNNAGLHHVPDELITPEFYLEAVKNNAWTLLDVPDEYKTPEMCLAAVKQDVRLIRHVPDELKDTVIKQLQNNNAVNESLTRIKELIGYKL